MLHGTDKQDQKIGNCVIMKGTYVNFIYWSKCDTFVLGLDPTCNHKSINNDTMVI